MIQAFFEQRVTSARGTDSQAADIMRHILTRQHLGRMVIVCDQPIAMLSAARKQWLKLSRTIQRQRAATLNADKILKYTHTITRMQRMQFTSKDALDYPDADVYCITSKQALTLPAHCYSLYLTVDINVHDAQAMATQLPQDALLIDYTHSVPWADFGMEPKSVLEQAVPIAWKNVRSYLRKQGVNVAGLTTGTMQNIDAMDDALDTLLNNCSGFLHVADTFQHALEMARPLRLSASLRMQYDAVCLLAHRVQALSPGAYNQRFLETYNEDDGFFLYDASHDMEDDTPQMIEEWAAIHRNAGRQRLAAAITESYQTRQVLKRRYGSNYHPLSYAGFVSPLDRTLFKM